jgi:hypothetical protein
MPLSSAGTQIPTRISCRATLPLHSPSTCAHFRPISPKQTRALLTEELSVESVLSPALTEKLGICMRSRGYLARLLLNKRRRMWRAKNRAVPVRDGTWRPRLAELSVPACAQYRHFPAGLRARTRCGDRVGRPDSRSATVESMKKPTARAFRMKLRKARRETQAANESVALFLGPKLLSELRILMRLASNGRGANGLAKDTPLKSY